MPPVIQDVYLKIERIFGYSPVEPTATHTYSYRRDYFRRTGHEDGTIPADEVELRKLTALVYLQYTDGSYATVDTTPLIPADLAEPPVDRRVPGCVLYTEPGRRLRIHVLNDDYDSHSLHMHGIQYAIDSDGAYPLGIKNYEGVRSDQICPGESYTYEYDVTEHMVGAWVFHDHHKNLGENARRGLIGGLVVRDPAWPQADYEVPFFMHTMAGRRAEPLFDSGDIAPTVTWSRVFDTTGDFAYECLFHTMFGTVKVEGGGPTSETVDIMDNSFDPATVTIAPGGTVTWTNTGITTHTVTEAGNSSSRMSHAINGRSFAGNTPVIEIETGKSVRWYVFNLDFGTQWHNFHPHASHWEFGGQNLDNRTIGPAESFVVNTVAPPVLLPPTDPKHFAGVTRTVNLAAAHPIHCHVEPHVMAGMVALMWVKQEMEITQAYEDSLAFPLPLDPGSFEIAPPEPHLCASAFDQGSWAALPDCPAFAVHSALLNTGKVMLWSGHAERGNTFGLTTALFDPSTDGFTEVPFSDPDDLFCSGHTFLANGQLIAGGGADHGEVKSTHLFDPATETWSHLDGGDLKEPRWYPTMVALNDGRVAIVSGDKLAGTADEIEVLDLSKPAPPPGVTSHYWDVVTGSAKLFNGLYPGLHLLPSGDLFFTRTGWKSHTGLGNDAMRFRFDAPVGSMSGAWHNVSPMTFPDRREGCSVLIIDDSGTSSAARVFVAGGRDTGVAAVPDCEIIDVTDPTTAPPWSKTSAMTHARIGNSAVVLPTGKIMVIGGRQTSGRFDPTPVFVYECEIYDPDTDTWALTPAMSRPRQYHSVAILLPDGRVLTSGGVDASWGDPNRKTTEAYSPEYLSAATRPTITNAPSVGAYGATIFVESNDAPTITAVSLIAPGAMTHHTDTFQRYIKLEIVSQTATSVEVRLPGDGNTAPPGYYMLFLLDGNGIPSEGHFLQVS